jgi:hypothetical protein
MESLPVFVADWEMECCGAPFSIGTEVRWDLQFLYEDEVSAPSEALLPAGSAVTVAATAAIPEPAAAEGLRGVLLATWHGCVGDHPSVQVAGTVRRIRLVRQFTVQEDRHVTFVRAGAELTELTESRDRFARGTQEESWAETGLLVDLATDLSEVIATVSS